MKIHNSTVQFNVRIARDSQYRQRFHSIEEVPYWAVYALPNDKYTPNEYLSTYTMNELTLYLSPCEKFGQKRLLKAYPRKSRETRPVYRVNKCNNSLGDIINKKDGEVVMIYRFDEKYKIIYIADDYKDKQKYLMRLLNRKRYLWS